MKVMSAIERCRTAALGGHVARCVDCAHEHIAYNSCRNRHCPKCQAGAAKAWLVAREAELLPVRYFHLVFTLPKQIANIAHQNKREIYNLLMRASADTVIKITADPKHLGARAGIISVLHIWGSAMTHHLLPGNGLPANHERAHVHMIVPGGGLSVDSTKWIACRKNFFLSVRVLSRLYRRLILEGLTKLHKAGKLHFFGEHVELIDRNAFDDFLKPLHQIDWVVYAKEPFAGPKAVLAYLSRYTHRIAISNSRLIRFDENSVTFKVKDYRLKGAGRHTTMTLATGEFIRRFLLHVLPRGQHRIRHYGFFGNGNRAANIARIRQLLGAKTPDHQHIDDTNTDDADQPPRVLALPCPCCGGQLIIVETIAPAQHPRAPPDPKRAAA
ncbi:Transposase zinc-binding domain-containing protein [Antarctobacter heliothermus]|uniref:Transposase zinc-binding domain-containing protein n=1 Tax=Antarctobacter heliothermus TaxID=74033 RepID=A0A239LPC2_9RHOB|nr:Transposase zinc-binding domain-containing protein [Antarctobacter heliothermus]